jgi:ribosomal protein S18 acetylase RimI-like enzyme
MSLPAEALTIRVLTPADVPAALHLSNESGWNQREQDWRAAVGMTPGASFCATADGAVVGTCIGIAYGTFSWIAMMLVDPAFQRRGLGAGLLLRTIDALPPDQPIGLDATAVGRLLYEQHGFHDACSLTRWIADRARLEQPQDAERSPDQAATIRAIDSSDLPAIASVDRNVFGGDRGRVLEWALAVGPDCCAIATTNGQPAGYVFGRAGRVFTHLGAVVARSQPVAQALVRHVAKAANSPLGIDAFDALPEWTEWLATCGFVRQRPLARMMRPPAHERSKVPKVEGSKGLRAFSIFGPEFA